MSFAGIKGIRSLRLDGERAWKDSVAAINSFVTDVIATVADIDRRVEYVDLDILGGTYGSLVTVTGSKKPRGVQVVGVQQKLSPSTTNTGSFAVDWEYRGGSIKIRNISGLTSGTRYVVTIAVLYGST